MRHWASVNWSCCVVVLSPGRVALCTEVIAAPPACRYCQLKGNPENTVTFDVALGRSEGRLGSHPLGHVQHSGRARRTKSLAEVAKVPLENTSSGYPKHRRPPFLDEATNSSRPPGTH